MFFIKRIIFSIPFIISFLFYCLLLRKFLDNPNLLFGIDMPTFLLSIWVVFSALLTGLFFSLFVTISQDKKIVASSLPAILLCSYLLLPDSSRFIVAIGSFFLFILVYLSLQHTLNTYITFTPTILLSPSINWITTFLFILGSISFYLSFQQSIKKQGFSLPQPVFDAINKAIPQDQFSGLIEEPASSQGGQSVTSEQLQQLKSNPELMKQFGLTSDMLNQVAPKGKTINPQQFIQSQIKEQINAFIKPFEPFLALIFAVIFFFNLRFLAAILGLFIGPLLSLVFLILDKTKFTTYTIENRPTKKLMV